MKTMRTACSESESAASHSQTSISCLSELDEGIEVARVIHDPMRFLLANDIP